jgi:hypothetical protein
VKKFKPGLVHVIAEVESFGFFGFCGLLPELSMPDYLIGKLDLACHCSDCGLKMD